MAALDVDAEARGDKVTAAGVAPTGHLSSSFPREEHRRPQRRFGERFRYWNNPGQEVQGIVGAELPRLRACWPFSFVFRSLPHEHLAPPRLPFPLQRCVWIWLPAGSERGNLQADPVKR